MIAAAFFVPKAAQAQTAQPATPDMTFTDGTVARSFGHCGDMDLCATITYPNGDVLSIYSEGAAMSQPYTLHCVRVHGDHTLYEFSRITDGGLRGNFGRRTSRLTLDCGHVYMDVDMNPDGTISVLFSPRTQ
jgi:hypothetical protein